MTQIDHDAVALALRNRAKTLVVAATVSANLEQTTTGFKRSVGSFVDEGFLVGMEVVPSGFATNTIGVIYSVTATELKVTGTRSAVPEGPGRALTVGLPRLRQWEGRIITPDPEFSYLVEEYSPSTSEVRSLTASGGLMDDTGDYFLTWYNPISVDVIKGVGSKALRRSVDALKNLYPAGLVVVASNSLPVHIRTKPAPATGSIITSTSWLALQLKIPWRVLWTNGVTS